MMSAPTPEPIAELKSASHAESALRAWALASTDRLVEAGAIFERMQPAELAQTAGQADLLLRDVHAFAEAALRVITLFREPERADYDAVQVLRERAFMNLITPEAELTARRYCRGDALQVAAGVRLVLESFQLTSGGHLRVSVTAEDNRPRVVFKLDGGGAPPEMLPVPWNAVISLDDFAQRWIAATGGGHIALSEEAMILYLEGDRTPPQLHLDRYDWRECYASVERTLRPWRGAQGIYEPGYVSPEEAATMYREAIAEALDAFSTAQFR